MAQHVSLNADRFLLDPGFEGYKLSLDPFPTYSVSVEPEVDDVELGEEQFTLDHMRMYGMYNHLHMDPWHHDSLYFVDRAGRLVNVRVVLDTHVDKGKPVWQLPWEGACTQGRVCSSLSFPSEELAAVADGIGSLHLLRTGCRGEEGTTKWKLLLSVEVPLASLLVHAMTLEGRTDCLLLRVEPDEAVESKSGFRTALEWLTLSAASGSTCLELTRRRLLHGLCAPHYAALEPSGMALTILADRPFHFFSDSANPIEPELPCSEAEMPDEDENERQKVVLYRWQQSADDITVTFSLVECTVKADVEVEVKSHYLKVGLKGQEPLLEGELAGPADAEGTTWLLSDGRLEITIQKVSAEGSQNWTEVVKGDQRGELDPEYVATAQEAVSQLTADHMMAEPDGGESFNVQELEECDEYNELMASLSRIDGETHSVTHTANIAGHQFLFSAVMAPGSMPAFCLRHDVDGLLWQPRPNSDGVSDAPWQHVATFNALGYVQASKSDRKFITCSPSASFVVLCECSRRLFLYRSPMLLTSPLYNRHDGRVVSHVARQQLATLDSSESILGLQASEQRLFALTTSSLFVLRVDSHGAQES
uniref:NudC domain-containing protein 1 n=1 Tax=Eptatretus burgeri TaxID=7764 RepID=A0A8C4PZ05_EPTBU